VRALVVSNMLTDVAHPARGSFVRDQVAALRALGGVELELHEFAPGPAALARALPELRRRYGGPSTLSRRPGSPPFDVVHAHFGLSAWPALAVPARVRALTVHGNDLAHPRTRLATTAVLPLIDLLAAASPALVQCLPGRRARERAQVLPCGVDMERFRAIPRERARAELGLHAERRLLLLPADPARAEKRADRARALAHDVGAELLTLGDVQPERMPLWINAADAVVVPSEREGFGLAVLEALACEVPVLATPVGIHAEALAGVQGTLCAPFDLALWREALKARLESPDPRVAGRASAQRFSSLAMAERVRAAWQRALEEVPRAR
jgi:glycosyltransferase involved in cell wall biosynthesis